MITVQIFVIICGYGGMVYALVLGTSAERRVGSSPTIRSHIIQCYFKILYIYRKNDMNNESNEMTPPLNIGEVDSPMFTKYEYVTPEDNIIQEVLQECKKRLESEISLEEQLVDKIANNHKELHWSNIEMTFTEKDTEPSVSEALMEWCRLHKEGTTIDFKGQMEIMIDGQPYYITGFNLVNDDPIRYECTLSIPLDSVLINHRVGDESDFEEE